jgi:hypothetical protein
MSRNIKTLVAATFALVTLVFAAFGAAQAQQQSIDIQAVVQDTFSKVEHDRNAFNDIAAPEQKKIADLLSDGEALAVRRSTIAASSLSPEEKAEQLSQVDAEITQNGAAYIHEAVGLVTGAQNLIVQNLAALQELATKLRDAGPGASSPAELGKKIADEQKSGRALVQQIQTLMKQADANPAVRRRIASLVATGNVIDRTITVQKSRLAADRKAGLDEKTGRVGGMIGDAINGLSDMAVALDAERQQLSELNSELRLHLELRTIDAAKGIILHALPNLAAPEKGVVPGLDTMTDRIHAIDSAPSSSGDGPPNPSATEPVPALPTFKNF